MSSALYGLGRWAFRHRGVVVMVWLAVLLALFALAGVLSSGTDNTYRIPGTESQQALDALARTFPQVSGASAQLIAVAPDGGSVTDADFEAAVEASVTAIGEIPQVAGVVNQGLAAAFGGVGRIVSIAIGMFAIAAGLTSTVPPVIAGLARSLPTAAADALLGATLDQAPWGIALLGLVVALLVGFGLVFAGVAARRRVPAA